MVGRKVCTLLSFLYHLVFSIWLIFKLISHSNKTHYINRLVDMLDEYSPKYFLVSIVINQSYLILRVKPRICRAYRRNLYQMVEKFLLVSLPSGFNIFFIFSKTTKYFIYHDILPQGRNTIWRVR